MDKKLSATKNNILAQGFRQVRELMGISQPAYARLFDAERALVQELEEGKLPAVLDQRLLKFMLLVFTLNRKGDFIAALLQEIRNSYGLDYIFSKPFPLLELYKQVLDTDINNWPWIVDSVRFRCRAIERKRLGGFVMLWGEKSVHERLLEVFPNQVSAFMSFIDNRTIIVVPSIYLFLDINTAKSNNPLVKSLELKLERRETIGLALPKELPTLQTMDTIAWEKMRLFAYSQDAILLKEASYH